MRSIHFYGYTGSLVEPPCTQFAEWRIMDTPMLVSRKQLFQMKNLIFRHVDGRTCQRTSNHYMGEAARPVQGPPLKRHRLYRCTCRDFLADYDRDMDPNVTRCEKSEMQAQLMTTLAYAGS